MNIGKKLLALIVVLVNSMSAFAYVDVDLNDNGFISTYRIYFNPTEYAELIKVVRAETSVSDTLIVPEFINPDGYNNFKVTAIRPEYNSNTGRCLFHNYDDCPSFIDMSHVSELGRECFRNCQNLKQVKLGKDLKNLYPFGNYTEGYDSYLSCNGIFENTGLTEIDLSYVINVGDRTFMNCKDLTSITFCDNLKYLGYLSLAGTNIKELDLKNYTPEEIHTYIAHPYDHYPQFSKIYLREPIDYWGDLHLTKLTAPKLTLMPSLGASDIRFIDYPEVIKICISGLRHATLLLPKLRRMYGTSATIDYLYIPKDCVPDFTYEEYNVSIFGMSREYREMEFEDITFDRIDVAPGNKSFYIKDGLLLEKYECSVWHPGWYDQKSDTRAIAAVGFPKGVFVPRNNPYNAVPYNLDYVDKVMIDSNFDPNQKDFYSKPVNSNSPIWDRGPFRFLTYERPDDNPVKVYIQTVAEYVAPLLGCFGGNFEYYVPNGSRLRFLSAGYPADRVFEYDPSAVDEIAADSTDTVEVYNLSGVRVGTSTEGLAPGMYIVRSGDTVRKTLVR